MKTINNYVPSVIFYHFPCPDGFGAYVIALKKLRLIKADCKYIPYDHRDEIPREKVKNQNILMIDCCYNRKKLETLKSLAANVYVLDHHQGAKDECGDLDFCYFDISKSGIRLAWEFFFPEEPIPAFVYYIEDRDLHAKNYPESNNFCAYVDQLSYDPNKWLDLLSVHVGTKACYEIITKGTAYNDIHARITNDIAEAAFPIRLCGHDILALNAQRPFNSSCLTKIINENAHLPFAMSYYIEYIQAFNEIGARLSFRSKTLNLIPIAKKFGGGGHPNAAGAIVKLDVLMDILKMRKYK